MKSEANDEAAEFRKECIRWQEILGLTDWVLHIKAQEAVDGDDAEAMTDFDCETRHAMVTYYYGIKDAMHPRDVAYHEMLHLLFADMLLIALQARDESDPWLGREEHRVIYRLAQARGKK